MIRAVAAALLAASLALPASAQTTTPPPPVREITKIKDEVYRFRNNNHYSVFAVTPAGIIATDPINAAAATWLKEEMKKRWPDKPIKFVVYSHDHADHISGGEVWTDTATVVAHENARNRSSARSGRRRRRRSPSRRRRRSSSAAPWPS
jgi:glyoxylase-like metal-dependent hydrolase (beta-lactamase superfamily II)